MNGASSKSFELIMYMPFCLVFYCLVIYLTIAIPTIFILIPSQLVTIRAYTCLTHNNQRYKNEYIN